MSARLIKGPHNVRFGTNVVEEASDISFDYSVDTDDVETVQGHKYRFYGAHQATAKLTVLKNNVAVLAVLLPQYYVPKGGQMSSGETVTADDGAMDFVPGGCDNEVITADFVVESCGTDGEDLVLKDATSEISGLNIDPKKRTIEIEFTGQSSAATIQIFGRGGLSGVS